MKRKTDLLVGVDVGSTTTKIVAVEKLSKKIIFSNYQRHCSAQVQSVAHALALLHQKFPETEVCIAFTGSGAKPIAQRTNTPYIQEVVANSIALRKLYYRL